MTLTTALQAFGAWLQQRSETLPPAIERTLPRILVVWLLVVGSTALLRLPPAEFAPPALAAIMLVLFAPPAALFLTLRSLDGSSSSPNPLPGVGMLLLPLLFTLFSSMAVRTGSYLLALPAPAALAPDWLLALHAWLTLDAALSCTLYAVAVAAGLHRSSRFPALLMLAWLVDLMLQLAAAPAMAGAGLPLGVAAAHSELLQGNVMRVLVSVGIWLPCLLLAQRSRLASRGQLPA